MVRYLLVLIALSSFAACKSYDYFVFSNDLIKEFNLEREDIKKIQFYISDDIHLLSQEVSGAARIKDGKLEKERQTNLDEFFIRRHTPGIVKGISPNGQLQVVFDAQRPDCVLMFGPHPTNKQQYVLLAEKWGKRFGKIPYCGTNYNLSRQYKDVHLLVDSKYSNKTNKKTKTARGATVN